LSAGVEIVGGVVVVVAGVFFFIGPLFPFLHLLQFPHLFFLPETLLPHVHLQSSTMVVFGIVGSGSGIVVAAAAVEAAAAIVVVEVEFAKNTAPYLRHEAAQLMVE
jgi:hypothetical protein